MSVNEEKCIQELKDLQQSLDILAKKLNDYQNKKSSFFSTELGSKRQELIAEVHAVKEKVSNVRDSLKSLSVFQNPEHFQTYLSLSKDIDQKFNNKFIEKSVDSLTRKSLWTTLKSLFQYKHQARHAIQSLAEDINYVINIKSNINQVEINSLLDAWNRFKSGTNIQIGGSASEQNKGVFSSTVKLLADFSQNKTPSLEALNDVQKLLNASLLTGVKPEEKIQLKELINAFEAYRQLSALTHKQSAINDISAKAYLSCIQQAPYFKINPSVVDQMIKHYDSFNAAGIKGTSEDLEKFAQLKNIENHLKQWPDLYQSQLKVLDQKIKDTQEPLYKAALCYDIQAVLNAKQSTSMLPAISLVQTQSSDPEINFLNQLKKTLNEGKPLADFLTEHKDFLAKNQAILQADDLHNQPLVKQIIYSAVSAQRGLNEPQAFFDNLEKEPRLAKMQSLLFNHEPQLLKAMFDQTDLANKQLVDPSSSHLLTGEGERFISFYQHINSMSDGLKDVMKEHLNNRAQTMLESFNKQVDHQYGMVSETIKGDLRADLIERSHRQVLEQYEGIYTHLANKFVRTDMLNDLGIEKQEETMELVRKQVVELLIKPETDSNNVMMRSDLAVAKVVAIIQKEMSAIHQTPEKLNKLSKTINSRINQISLLSQSEKNAMIIQDNQQTISSLNALLKFVRDAHQTFKGEQGFSMEHQLKNIALYAKGYTFIQESIIDKDIISLEKAKELCKSHFEQFKEKGIITVLENKTGSYCKIDASKMRNLSRGLSYDKFMGRSITPDAIDSLKRLKEHYESKVDFITGAVNDLFKKTEYNAVTSAYAQGMNLTLRIKGQAIAARDSATGVLIGLKNLVFGTNDFPAGKIPLKQDDLQSFLNKSENTHLLDRLKANDVLHQSNIKDSDGKKYYALDQEKLTDFIFSRLEKFQTNFAGNDPEKYRVQLLQLKQLVEIFHNDDVKQLDTYQSNYVRFDPQDLNTQKIRSMLNSLPLESIVLPSAYIKEAFNSGPDKTLHDSKDHLFNRMKSAGVFHEDAGQLQVNVYKIEVFIRSRVEKLAASEAQKDVEDNQQKGFLSKILSPFIKTENTVEKYQNQLSLLQGLVQDLKNTSKISTESSEGLLSLFSPTNSFNIHEQHSVSPSAQLERAIDSYKESKVEEAQIKSLESIRDFVNNEAPLLTQSLSYIVLKEYLPPGSEMLNLQISQQIGDIVQRVLSANDEQDSDGITAEKLKEKIDKFSSNKEVNTAILFVVTQMINIYTVKSSKESLEDFTANMHTQFEAYKKDGTIPKNIPNLPASILELKEQCAPAIKAVADKVPMGSSLDASLKQAAKEVRELSDDITNFVTGKMTVPLDQFAAKLASKLNEDVSSVKDQLSSMKDTVMKDVNSLLSSPLFQKIIEPMKQIASPLGQIADQAETILGSALTQMIPFIGPATGCLIAAARIKSNMNEIELLTERMDGNRTSIINFDDHELDSHSSEAEQARNLDEKNKELLKSIMKSEYIVKEQKVKLFAAVADQILTSTAGIPPFLAGTIAALTAICKEDPTLLPEDFKNKYMKASTASKEVYQRLMSSDQNILGSFAKIGEVSIKDILTQKGLDSNDKANIHRPETHHSSALSSGLGLSSSTLKQDLSTHHVTNK